MSPGRRTAAVLGLLGVLAGACGVPEDDSPRDLAQPLPAALQEADSSSTTQPPTAVVVTIFLARRTESQLSIEAVAREVDATDPSAAAIRAVLAPAAEEERDAGLSTLFGEGTALVETMVEGDVLDIRLDSLDGFPADPNSTDFQVAVAMLVCTATTSFEDVSSVLVSIQQEDGTFRPIAVRLPEQTAQPEAATPVSCEQFAPFLDPVPDTTAAPAEPSTTIAAPTTVTAPPVTAATPA